MGSWVGRDEVNAFLTNNHSSLEGKCCSFRFRQRITAVVAVLVEKNGHSTDVSAQVFRGRVWPRRGGPGRQTACAIFCLLSRFAPSRLGSRWLGNAKVAG